MFIDITGKNLRLVKNRLIVQTWRAQGWEKNDLDSTFIIELEPSDKDVILYVTHANLPDKHAGHIAKGWHDHYWNLWKAYLKTNIYQNPVETKNVGSSVKVCILFRVIIFVNLFLMCRM